MASDTSLVFYQNPTIILEGLEDGFPIWSTDFVSRPYIKEPGIFPSTPGSIFSARNKLTINAPDGYFTGYNRNIDHLRLRLEISDIEATAFSTIKVIPRPGIVEPSHPDANLSLYKFPHLRIISKIDPGYKYCEISIRIKYTEKAPNLAYKDHTFILYKDILFDPQSEELIKYIEPDLFFSHFANSFKNSEDEDLLYRRLTSFDLIITFGDQYFKDYFNTYYSSEDYGGVPKGNIVNGMGVFSILRSKRVKGFKFHPECLDSLVDGQYTKHLKFVR
ncbi:MAG: hypothetical protein U9N86_06680 [Bacteroidota bacterium]|nr:hypothetical protein [Bacteroidota bacterium]